MELFNDEQFEKYRVAELEEGVSVIKSCMVDGNQEYFRGAMDMLRRIINVPLKLVPKENESRYAQVQMLKGKSLAILESRLLRSFMESDE